MKLKEAIRDNKGNDVKIGAASAFIYCALCDDKTVKTIKKLSEEEYKRLKRERDKNEEHKRNFVTFWDNSTRKRLTKVIKESKLDKIQANIDKALTKIKRDKERDKKTTENNIVRFTERYENYIPFLEREVKEIYKTDLSDEVYIIFEGLENGDYWDAKEYKEGGKHE